MGNAHEYVPCLKVFCLYRQHKNNDYHIINDYGEYQTSDTYINK